MLWLDVRLALHPRDGGTWGVGIFRLRLAARLRGVTLPCALGYPTVHPHANVTVPSSCDLSDYRTY